MKKMEKMKKMSLLMIVIISFVALTNCASYYGTEDPNVPMSRNATLKIDSRLSAITFNGERVHWGAGFGLAYVNIPAGEHTFTFNYYRQSSTSTHIITTTARGIAVSGTFEAGNTYIIVPRYLSGDRIQAQIFLENEEEPKDTFSCSESQSVMGAAITSPTGGAFYMGFTFGRAYENDTRRTAWNIETGMNMRAWGNGAGIDILLGANYEYYFDKRGDSSCCGLPVIHGLTIGGGVAFPIFDLDSVLMQPYIRLGFLTLHSGGMKTNIYLSYSFYDFYKDKYGEDDAPIPRFAFGVNFLL